MSMVVCKMNPFHSILSEGPPAASSSLTGAGWHLPPEKGFPEAEKGGGGEDPPYVHPLLRTGSGSMSPKSLETCTERLGSETGADFFSFSGEPEAAAAVTPAALACHCAPGRRFSTGAFPPPLPSVAGRGGGCVSMRRHRRDGRLVVEAVPVPSRNYLHAERREGRLLLSLVSAAASAVEHETGEAADLHAADEEEEEEEEVEVVERGTVVEVKVSTQPQQHGGAARVLRSSLVINKFVGVTPPSSPDPDHLPPPAQDLPSKPRRGIPTATAAAAAIAAASAAAEGDGGDDEGRAETKVLFTSKGSHREELLRSMRRCRELRRPLFIWEPCWIATSS